MVKINKIEEIDHERLNALFKRRGRKITIPLFTKKVLETLEAADKKYEVHQCKCGEVMIFRTDYADYLRKQLNTEDIPCNSCLELSDLDIPGQIFVNLSNILKIMERRKIDKNQQRIYYTDKDFEQLKKEGRGLFATTSIDEFYFGFHNFSNAFFDEFPEKESLVCYPLILEIMESAIKINPNIFKEFEKTADAEGLDAASLNTYLVRKSRIDFSSKISDEKFLKSEISDFHSSETGTSYSKLDIKLKMTEYKDLVEQHKYFFNPLLNLINIIEGREFVSNPFDKLKLPPRRPEGKELRIKGLRDKIELFKYHYFGDKLYPLLSDIFDTKLRNDEAHNTYEIDIERRVVRSTKYKKETSFEELDEKIDKISSLYSFFTNNWTKRYFETQKPLMKNLGIEEISLGYVDPVLIDGKLFPNNNCMSELGIYQYWDFAYYENEKRWIPIPELSFNKEFKISFENGNTFDYELDSDVELWLGQLILYGAYNLSLYTIAPALPTFNTKSIAKIPVGGMPEVNILEVKEKVIELPKKSIKDISEKINL
uniref:Uncharacterized protein n=1 Tax=Candidatus Methanophagaceae archaeon ANME-1 ERB6 TaxID=2759912 RepID=A0A7G9YVK8_9EURY|nr:hypothetical protein HGMICNAC_00044 [Methanosarcinales archaeon ANME-1 ERB6]